MIHSYVLCRGHLWRPWEGSLSCRLDGAVDGYMGGGKDGGRERSDGAR